MLALMFIMIFVGSVTAHRGIIKKEKLTIVGNVVDEKGDDVMTLVTLYKYNSSTQQSVYIDQMMVEGNGHFKFKMEYNGEFMIELAANNGVNKRIMIDTELARAYQEDKYKFEFDLDINDTKAIDNPMSAAFIYFDAQDNGFNFSLERPMSASAE